MNIWIVNHYAAPPSMAGGTRHYSLAKQLIQRGHSVTLVAANYNHFSHTYISSNVKLGEIDNTHDLPFIWIPVPAYTGNTVSRFWNMLVFSWRILQKKYLPTHTKPDMILGSSPHLFAALGAQRLAKKFKIPFILEVRDLWPETLVDLGRISARHPLIILMKKIETYLYHSADKVISLLPLADKYLIKNGVKPENILWLPNSVDTDVIPTQLPRTENDKFTIMYAGAHGMANDLDTVIHAAKILQDKSLSQSIRICLIGSGPEKSRLQELALALNVTIVEFHDAVSKNEIYSILNKADAFLMLLKSSPLFRWGISPNKLFDYFIMARPVIFGVDTQFNPVEKYHAGISIKPSDPNELATAMYNLSLLPKDELHNMGERGKDFVLQHHHIAKLTDSLESLMRELQVKTLDCTVTPSQS